MGAAPGRGIGFASWGRKRHLEPFLSCYREANAMLGICLIGLGLVLVGVPLAAAMRPIPEVDAFYL